MKETLNFRVSSGIKDIVGKDLITDDFIAVYELVKNSYDAYAKNVLITFEENKIIIADNGKGMSLKDIKDKWLFLAFSAKKDGTEDENSKNESYRDLIQEKRYYAGAKGVGRFSVDRLGSKLILTTKIKNSGLSEQIQIDWNKFNNQNEEFGEVSVGHTTLNSYNIGFPENADHGLILEISQTKPWDREKILALKHSLEKLINPFATNNSFNIKIKCTSELRTDIEGKYTSGVHKGRKYYHRDKVNGNIKNAILDVLNLKTTQISVCIKNGKITTKITDRNELIYHIEEEASKLSLIKNLKIDLYYLNRSAKINFGKLMGMEPKNFGSVMLFKNGFRILPYGQYGNDSWGLDIKVQQGYGRFLSSRELFGRVDITTDDNNEFKEVSSRDGGLIKTQGSEELFETFKTAKKRLERYVVGVLWGEGFRKKNYFGEGKDAIEEVKKQRDLLDEDKDSDNIDIAKKNIGSGLDFIQIIKNLSANDKIKIIGFNNGFVENVNSKIDEIQSKFVTDLHNVIEQTGDNNLKTRLLKAEKEILERLERVEREKEEEEKKRIKAEEAQKEEERKRNIAEKEKKEEEEKRAKAESEKREEEQKRIKAELKAEKKEKERLQEELKRLLAEKKAEEEIKKNIDLSDKLNIETKKNQYLNATRKTLSDDAEQLVHSIDLYVGNASTYINELLLSNIEDDNKAKVYSIKNNIDKAIKVSQIIIKSSFDYKYINQRINLPVYINEYLEDINLSRKDIKIETINIMKKFFMINPIDVDIIFDNLISNSVKAKAKKVLVEFIETNNKLEIFYHDDGIGVSDRLSKNPNSIFELGVRDSNEKGSGIGMYDVKKRVANLRGSIEFNGNNKKFKGASFKIVL